MATVALLIIGSVLYWPVYKRRQAQRYLEIMGDTTALDVTVGTRFEVDPGTQRTKQFTCATHPLPGRWRDLRARIGKDETGTALVFDDPTRMQRLVCTVANQDCRKALQNVELQRTIWDFLIGDGHRAIGDGEIRLELEGQLQDGMAIAATQSEVAELLERLEHAD